MRSPRRCSDGGTHLQRRAFASARAARGSRTRGPPSVRRARKMRLGSESPADRTCSAHRGKNGARAFLSSSSAAALRCGSWSVRVRGCLWQDPRRCTLTALQSTHGRGGVLGGRQYGTPLSVNSSTMSSSWLAYCLTHVHPFKTPEKLANMGNHPACALRSSVGAMDRGVPFAPRPRTCQKQLPGNTTWRVLHLSFPVVAAPLDRHANIQPVTPSPDCNRAAVRLWCFQQTTRSAPRCTSTPAFGSVHSTA